MVLLAFSAWGCRSGLSNGKGHGDGAADSSKDAVTTRRCSFVGFADATHYPTEVEGLRLLPVDLVDAGRRIDSGRAEAGSTVRHAVWPV